MIVKKMLPLFLLFFGFFVAEAMDNLDEIDAQRKKMIEESRIAIKNVFIEGLDAIQVAHEAEMNKMSKNFNAIISILERGIDRLDKIEKGQSELISEKKTNEENSFAQTSQGNVKMRTEEFMAAKFAPLLERLARLNSITKQMSETTKEVSLDIEQMSEAAKERRQSRFESQVAMLDKLDSIKQNCSDSSK